MHPPSSSWGSDNSVTMVLNRACFSISLSNLIDYIFIDFDEFLQNAHVLNLKFEKRNVKFLLIIRQNYSEIL